MCAASHCLHNGASASTANLWVCMCLPCQTFLQGGFKAIKKCFLLVSLKVASLHRLKYKSYWFAVHHVDSRFLSFDPTQQSWDASWGVGCALREGQHCCCPPSTHGSMCSLMSCPTQTQLLHLPLQHAHSKTIPPPLLL